MLEAGHVLILQEDGNIYLASWQARAGHPLLFLITSISLVPTFTSPARLLLVWPVPLHITPAKTGVDDALPPPEANCPRRRDHWPRNRPRLHQPGAPLAVFARNMQDLAWEDLGAPFLLTFVGS